MRKYIIGDIRGDLNLLQRLMDKIGPSNADLVIFLGSYLGPGPDSKGVVEYLLSLLDKDLNVHFLKGCYEYMFENCIGTSWSITKEIQGPPPWEMMELWGRMGGKRVFKSYAAGDKPLYLLRTGANGRPVPSPVEIPMVIPERHIRFLQNLHQWFEDDTYPIIASHAGGHPSLYGRPLQNEEELVFGEKDWWKNDWKFIPDKTIIFSHVPEKEIFVGRGKVGIDLGAGLGGRLAAYEIVGSTITVVG